MTPPCHNRPTFTDPNAGWRFVEWRADASGFLTRVLRYRHPWFTDRCTVHDRADIGPNQTYAQAHGWDCTGCKWRPQ